VGWCGQGGSGGGGCAFECARGGEAGAKKKPKTELAGSVSGVPCQTAVCGVG